MRKRDLDYVLCALLYSMKKQHADRWGGFRSFLNTLYIYIVWYVVRNKYRALRMWIKTDTLLRPHQTMDGELI